MPTMHMLQGAAGPGHQLQSQLSPPVALLLGVPVLQEHQQLRCSFQMLQEVQHLQSGNGRGSSSSSSSSSSSNGRAGSVGWRVRR
jgi:hypothetical protein